MWKKRENHILEVYKNDQLVIEQKLIRKSHPQQAASNETNQMYQGCEFDVFGIESKEEQFAPLYSKDQFTPKNKEELNKFKKDSLLRTEPKRGQIEAMLQHTTTIKKRKMSPTIAPPVVNHVFYKSTASANSPIASIFVDTKEEHEDDDLAYY